MSYYYNPYGELYHRIPDMNIRQIPLGSTWYESEAGWSGVWRRQGNSNIFHARWTKSGQRDVTAVLTIEIDGNLVLIRRRNSSDGVNCNYAGWITNDGRIAGGCYSCRAGHREGWGASISLP